VSDGDCYGGECQRGAHVGERRAFERQDGSDEREMISALRMLTNFDSASPRLLGQNERCRSAWTYARLFV